jgi:hypothetical protein
MYQAKTEGKARYMIFGKGSESGKTMERKK